MIDLQVRRVVPVAALLTVYGCTSIETTPDYRRTASADQALPGIAYALPMLQYAITLEYTLKSCINETTKLPAPVVDVRPSVLPTYVPAERYLIAYEELTHLWKITDFTVETYAGTDVLKSINLSADDQTAEFISSVVDVGLSAAALAAGTPTTAAAAAAAKATTAEPAPPAPFKVYATACTPFAESQLASRHADIAALKTMTSELADTTTEIESIRTRVALGLINRKDRAEISNLVKLLSEAAALTRAINDAATRVAAAQKALGFTEAVRWPGKPADISASLERQPEFETWRSKLLTTTAIALPLDSGTSTRLEALRDSHAHENAGFTSARELLDTQLKSAAADLALSCPHVDAQASAICMSEKLTVKAVLFPASPLPGEPSLPLASCGQEDAAPNQPCVVDARESIVASDRVSDSGLFIRPPMLGALLLCSGSQSCTREPGESFFVSAPQPVPQLGQLRFVRFTNGPFQNNALVIAMAEDGSLSKLQYSNKAAVAAAAAASASAVAGKLATDKKARDDADDAREKAEAAAVTAARTEAAAVRTDEIARLQYEIDLIEKGKALDQLKSPSAQPPPDEAALLNAELAVLRARLEKKLIEEQLGGKP